MARRQWSGLRPSSRPASSLEWGAWPFLGALQLSYGNRRSYTPGEGRGPGAKGQGGLSVVGLGRTGGPRRRWEASQVGARRVELKSRGPFEGAGNWQGRRGVSWLDWQASWGCWEHPGLPACFCEVFSAGESSWQRLHGALLSALGAFILRGEASELGSLPPPFPSLQRGRNSSPSPEPGQAPVPTPSHSGQHSVLSGTPPDRPLQTWSKSQLVHCWVRTSL